MKEITSKVKYNIVKKLKKEWDIRDTYWYPLSQCIRDDVVSLDYNSFEKNKTKLELIRKCLEENGIEEIYELRENGSLFNILDISTFQFWFDEYYWNNECFWFDASYNWIIYISHEQTLTLGGGWLINEFKNYSEDWKEILKWNTKNM